jgi:hypothetical protein
MYTPLNLHEELRQLKRLVRRARAARRSDQGSQDERLEELEAGVGRLALVLRALAELAVERGLIRSEDLVAKMNAVDGADGAEDETLDPRVVLPGESKLAELEPLVPPPAPRSQGR